jgi:hypothetical protein
MEFSPLDPYRVDPHWRRGIQVSPAGTIANAVHVTLSCRSKRNEFRFTMILSATCNSNIEGKSFPFDAE